MSKVRPIYPAFTTGELSPLMWGRVDFQKYLSGLRTLLNYLVRPQGPVFRRPGTRFVAEVKDSTKATRLVKFEFSTTQAYILEVGHQYIRFYKDGGRIQLTVTGCANNGAGLIRVTTSAAHTMSTGMRVAVSGVTGTTESNGTWVVTNVDATHFDLQTSAFANAYVSGGIAIPDIATPWASTDLTQLRFVQSADVMYFVHPDYAPQKLTRTSHTNWTLAAVNFLPPATYEAGFKPATTLTLAAVTGLGVVATAGAAVFEDSDVGRMVTVGVGRATIRSLGGVAPNALANVDIVDTFASVGPHASGGWTIEGSPNTTLTPTIAQPAHAIVTLNLAARGYRATDLGRYIRVNKGVVRITNVVSATSAEAELLTTLANTTASPGGSWSVEDPEWSSARGYPRAVAFFEQRLILAGSKAKPQAFWGTNTGRYEVVGLASDDDDAFEYLIAANDVNTINWIVPTKSMLMGTASTEFAVRGSDGATNPAITPSSVDVKSSTFWGSSERVAPIRIGNAVLFVTRTGTELRELLFQIERDDYNANNLLLLASHLTTDVPASIVDIAYQRHPHSTVWCVRSDGVLLALAYQREHDVVGWSRCITGPDGQEETPVKGKFEAVAVTPHWNGDRDVAWFVVQRTINGVTKRYVEYMDDVGGYYNLLGMDSALTYSGAATKTFTGLGHLAGETVAVLGAGAVYPSAVVSGAGEVTIDGPAVARAEIGLGFNSKLVTMAPEVPVHGGTSQGLMKHWSRLWVRVYKTLGMRINGEDTSFRRVADPMDGPPARFTGDVEDDPSGRDRDGVLTIEQTEPLPQTIVAIFGTMGVGE